MMTESTQLARLIAGVLRLSDADVESDERWDGVAELRQLDAEQIYEIAARSEFKYCGERDALRRHRHNMLN
jgi:hypothetical protein